MTPTRRTLSIAFLMALAGAALYCLYRLPRTDSSALAESTPHATTGVMAVATELEPSAAPTSSTPRRMAAADSAPVDEVLSAARESTRRLIRGRVIEPGGAGAGGALVALIEVQGGAPHSNGERQLVRSDESGRFRMDVPDWARTDQVLLVARRHGLRPYSLVTQLDDEFLAREHELALEVGFAISGRLIRDGRAVDDARVEVDAAFGTAGIFDAGAEALWVNGRLEEKHRGVQSSYDGRFEVLGLGPYEHRLSIGYVTGAVAAIGGRVLTAVAPSDRVYDLTSARLAVTVQSLAGPLTGVDLRVDTGHGSVVRERSMTPLLFEVPPQSAVEIRGRHPNLPPLELHVESPFAGQTLDVVIPVALVSRASLVVRLPGATQAGIEHLRLQLHPLEGSSATELTATAEAQPDSYRVAVVPDDPGDYLLVLEPSDHPGAGNFIGPRSARIQLPASGTVHADFELELYGRCRVDISVPNAQSWSATYRLIDGDGRVFLERSIHRHALHDSLDGGDMDLVMESFSMESSSDGPHAGTGLQSSPATAARNRGVLPASVYMLEVESSGPEKCTQSVIVKAAETTIVAVELLPLESAPR